MQRSRIFPFLLLLLFNHHSSNATSLLRGAGNKISKFTSVLCRVVTLETLFENDDNDTNTDEEFRVDRSIGCIPIVNNTELHDAIPLTLPENFTNTYITEIARGQLLVNITRAQLIKGRSSIAMSADSQFLVVDNTNLRDAQTLFTQGSITVAIIRISALDSSPTPTVEDLESLFDPTRINFVSQYNRCSFGKLNISKAQVVDFRLYQAMSTFGNSGSGAGPIIQALQVAFKERMGMDIKDLADRVMLCLPPGTGDWVASAGVHHWRSQFNDIWCMSLSATMHELGHTIGLLHSNQNNDKYADSTGYMAKAYRTTDGPLRCFNGQNNNYLGWYDDKKVIYNPLIEAPRVFTIAAFVDYAKAALDEPVLVNVADEIYLQYNRAKNFNNGTEEQLDKVTITTKIDAGGSNLLGAIGLSDHFEIPNFAASGRTLLIAGCQSISGGDARADVMFVSVGLDVSICNQVGDDTLVAFRIGVVDSRGGGA